MKEEMKAKRQQLKELSRIIQIAVKDGQYTSVNEGLAEIYAQEGHTELHSFKGWLTKGFAVKKGEKALLMWGQPKDKHKQEQQPEGEEEDKTQFWPLAYLFSQLQVEPLKKTG